MVFLFVASHSTDLVLPCKKDTLCFIENVSFSVPLKINDLGFDIIERGAAMIPTEDIIPTVKNTIAASIKCNTHRGYIGWSSCDNICKACRLSDL